MGKVTRSIVRIDEELCDGCGLCVPACAEGAIQIVDDKARLVSEIYCDGLGACVGHCPEGAMTVVEREAEPYDERKVMANIVEHGENTIAAHLEHLKEHGEMGLYREAVEYLRENGFEVPLLEPVPSNGLPCGCPGSMVSEFNKEIEPASAAPSDFSPVSRLTNWPVQNKLMPVHAPYLRGADLLLAADCVPFALADFPQRLLPDRVLVVGCPKLDDTDLYVRKLAQIFLQNDIESVEVAHMEVPCCHGLVMLVQHALKESGKDIPLTLVKVGIKGDILETTSPTSA